MQTDVTISVWNKFHSFPLIDGLTRNQFKVYANGVSGDRPNALVYNRAELSRIAYFLHRKIKCGNFALAGSLKFYEQFVCSHLGDAHFFWGWSGHHLKAFQRAKKLEKKIILERGSSHPMWRFEQMKSEHQRSDTGKYDYSKKLLEKELAEIELADYVSIPSQFVKDTFLQYGVSQKKLLVNPYGADVSYWRKASESRSCISARPLTFVWAGAVMQRKGVYYLLEAWKKAKLNHAKLLFVGGVSHDAKQYLDDLPEGVEICGYKTHAELLEIYKNADVGILPSLEEGMARSLLEAMSAALPLIITYETGMTQFINHQEHGWIVESKSIDDIVLALKEADANREGLADMGNKAYEVIKGYTWDAYGDRASKLFAEIKENDSI